MFKNTAILNLLEETVYVLPNSNICRSVSKNKKKPFIILNTDHNYGPFVKTIVKLAKQYGLTEQLGLFRDKSIKSIKTNELIVFGDTSNFANFDYRVETDPMSFRDFDNRVWKVYNLTAEFSKIQARLAQYAKENYGCTSNVPSREQDVNVGITIDIEVTAPRLKKNKPAITNCPHRCPLLQQDNLSSIFSPYQQPVVSVEDVRIHSYWVKIGYRQYDIMVDTFGNEYIIIEDGSIYQIKEDRFGRKYLAS